MTTPQPPVHITVAEAGSLLARALPMLEQLGDFIGNGPVSAERPGSLGARCDLILDIKAWLAQATITTRPGGSARRCFYVSPDALTEHGYIPSVVTEGEPGHAPLTGQGTAAAPWYWGHDYEQACRIAKKANAELGLSDADVVRIMLSSRGAGRAARTPDDED
jgi:hypothetical protein